MKIGSALAGASEPGTTSDSTIVAARMRASLSTNDACIIGVSNSQWADVNFPCKPLLDKERAKNGGAASVFIDHANPS